jgi:5-formyltetrahydrofolate cyclo-ligase
MPKKKQQIRQQLLQARQQMSMSMVQQLSDRIIQKLKSLALLEPTKQIALYYPTHNEVDILPVITYLHQKQKTTYFPLRNATGKYELGKVQQLKNDLVLGAFHIYEPKPSQLRLTCAAAKQSIDLWLIPGVAFDVFGNRLGHGYGIYDDFLKDAHGLKIGLAYDFQVNKQKLPTHKHDIKMDLLITETNLWQF